MAEAPPRQSPSTGRLWMLPAALLLVLMFGLALGSTLGQSPTVDEGLYIARGWAFWRTGHLLPVGHPPLASQLSGLGLLLEPGLPDPHSLQGWDDNNIVLLSRDFLWQQGINTSRVVLLARLPVIWLGLLLGALIARWGREIHRGGAAALVGLGLYALSPDVLAHTALATTDLVVAAFYITALYAWSRCLHGQSARWLVIAGIAFGLAQSAKFSALLLIPTLALMTIGFAWRRGPLQLRDGGPLAGLFRAMGRWPLGWLWTALLALLLMGLIGLLALWATYLFAIRQFEPGRYGAEMRDFLSLAGGGHRAYLLGRFSQTGWWYYHLVALGVKLPLAALLLLALALLLAAIRGPKPREWELLFPPALFLAATFVMTLSVGVRYLLPVVPLLFVFAGRLVARPVWAAWPRLVLTGLLMASLLATTLAAYPHYLAYFNLIGGGQRSGWRVLVDSNLDWGQDLPGLAAYLRERGAGPVYLSYFGQADPAYYGINYLALPAYPPPPDNALQAEFHPLNPAPGLYAISATHLVGVVPEIDNLYGIFRTREPVARIGGSIFVYEVPASPAPNKGERPWFARCATESVYERDQTLIDLTGVPDLRIFNFDCQQSLPFPEGAGWLLIPAGIEPVAGIGGPDYVARYPDGTPRYAVWIAAEPPPAPPSTIEFPAVALPLPVAGHLELLGYQVSAPAVSGGETLLLTAWWRVREPPPPPLSILAHLQTPEGTLLLAADGLGVPAEDWRPGTVIVQQHRFPISEDTPPGSYLLATGLYSLATGERYPVFESEERVIDRIVLRRVQISEPRR